ncbi:MATE family efflux transporter [Paenibacillus sp. NPDC055715]
MAILKIGIPAGLEWLSYQLSQMMVTRFVSFMGTTAIATHFYTNTIVYFFMVFGMAVGEGTEIIVARLIGAGDKKKAYHQLPAQPEMVSGHYDCGDRSGMLFPV